jgi:hypothetical protein
LPFTNLPPPRAHLSLWPQSLRGTFGLGAASLSVGAVLASSPSRLTLDIVPLVLAPSSKPSNIRNRASLYAASRSSIVIYFFLLVFDPLPCDLLEAPASPSSLTLPSVEVARDDVFDVLADRSDRRMILIVGKGVSSEGTSSQIRLEGLGTCQQMNGDLH